MSLRRVLFAFGAAAGAVTIITACAGGEIPDGEPDPPAKLPPGPDSGPPELPDAARDDRPDAAPRTCSDDGFCHTALPSSETLQAVWADGAGTAWAGTASGAILRFDGEAWSVHASGLGAIDSIWGSGSTDVWASGARGVYRGRGATPATVTFERAPLEPDADVHIASIWGTSATDVWAVGARVDGAAPRGRVYHHTGATTSDGAPVWSIHPVSSDDGPTYRRVWGSAGTGVWLVATKAFDEWGQTEEGVVRLTASSADFEPVDLPPVPDPDPWNADAPIARILGAAVESEASVWLALSTVWSRRAFYHGVSSDGGATFTWTVIPYEGSEEVEYTALAASRSGVWAAGRYGRLARWDGASFVQASTEVEPLPVIHPFFGLWTAPGGEVWAVGKDIALHRAKK